MKANSYSVLVECEKIVQDLEEGINTLKTKMPGGCDFSAMAVDLCKKALDILKNMVVETEFENQNDEIYFFKMLKTNVNSKLYFNLYVYEIQSSIPSGNRDIQLKALKREQKSANLFLRKNQEVYQYYRSGSRHLDYQYFVRGKSDLLLVAKNPRVYEDPMFSTSHDYLLSQIITNEMLLEYLEDEICKLRCSKRNSNEKEIRTEEEKLFWTDAKNALIELLYALYCIGAINNGNIDIKRLCRFFERVLNIDLGDIYHAFSEIKMRKKERTKYLDSLRDALIKRMDESDEK